MPRILRYFNPGYGICIKCGLPWNWCNSKSVMTSKYSGTFATCDYCWEHSTLEELKMHYTVCYKMQESCLLGTEHVMEHTLEHLLECVEAAYLLDCGLDTIIYVVKR